MRHYVNRRAFTAVGLHLILCRTDEALARALASEQVTPAEHVERHNLLADLRLRLIGTSPEYLAARLGLERLALSGKRPAT